ncbi:GDSL-type esterase/lipase family protein [Arthrobacter sp. LjRoot78]|uniref:GDSL-type esterase/lipase family protein n=1 Tax=Arthrobacter sp. LjRoot78 TaxID=3342338 RepID=UPI003ECFAA8D
MGRRFMLPPPVRTIYSPRGWADVRHGLGVLTLAAALALLPACAGPDSEADSPDTSDVTETIVPGDKEESSVAYQVRGAIGKLHTSDWAARVLSAPTSAEDCDKSGCLQHFEGGDIAWSARTGARVVANGPARDAWLYAGGRDGRFGYPSTHTEIGLRDGGVSQGYQGGVIVYSPATGTRVVSGAVRAHWASLGAQDGALGYPLGEETREGKSVYQIFQRGTLYWSAETGAHGTTRGDILNRYREFGEATGPLGLPLSEEVPRDEGVVQQFQYGWLVWSPSTGARMVPNETYRIWSANSGRFGWPRRDAWVDQRGTHVEFQSVETIWDPNTLELYSAEAVDSSSAVIIGDSQLDLDSWGEQGARLAGYSHQIMRGYGGMGYVATNRAAGGSALHGLISDTILLPQGEPGLVIVTLGGNDARIGATDAQILESANSTWDELKRKYPRSTIIINGVLSRDDYSHAQRRWVDGLLMHAAAARGLKRISLAGTASVAGAASNYQDANHLTQAGHNKVAPLYAEALRATR